jgi:diacylglycerol kinase (ATP)
MAARLEVMAGALALAWFVALHRPAAEIVLLIILLCLLLCVEALNTAIERVVERLSPEQSDFARITKDLGSTAVFCMLVGSGVYVLAVTAEAGGLIRMSHEG